MATFTPLDETGPLDKRTLAARSHHVPLGIVIDKTCRVYIAQIPVERIERDGAQALRSEFECFGPVESYRLFTERSGRFLGTALCTYRNPADAALAVKSMNGRVIESATLRVEVARDHGVVLLRRDAVRPSTTAAAGDALSRRHDGYDGARPPRDALGEGEGDDGKWRHDRYDALQREGDGGDDPDEGDEAAHHHGVRHRHRARGGGLLRGRGRGRGAVQRMRDAEIDREFERYIAERDSLLGVAAPPPASASHEAPANDNNDDDGGGMNTTHDNGAAAMHSTAGGDQ